VINFILSLLGKLIYSEGLSAWSFELSIHKNYYSVLWCQLLVVVQSLPHPFKQVTESYVPQRVL